MSENLDTIDGLPDISFIDNISLEDIQGSLLGDFVEKYQEITGKKYSCQSQTLTALCC